jgi:hypothetical protein
MRANVDKRSPGVGRRPFPRRRLAIGLQQLSTDFGGSVFQTLAGE